MRPGYVLSATTVVMVAVVAATPVAAEEDSARLVLEVETVEGFAGLDGEGLRSAIETELGVEVALAGPGVEGRGRIRLRFDEAGRATVTFVAGAAKPVVRTVELPKSTTLAIETVALLAGNLVRNEAAELLETLRPIAKAKLSTKATASTPAGSKSLAPAPPPPPLGEPCLRSSAFAGADVMPAVGVGQDDTRALSFGLLGTWSRGVRGVELSTVLAVARGNVCGAQVGGAAAWASGDVRGVQLGGATAITPGRLFGVQLGGAFAGAFGGIDGVMVAGGVGYAGRVRGAMIAPVNVASANVDGGQLGVVNVTSGEVRGVQLGLLNVARDADAPIGLVSVMTHGRTHVDVWGNETGLAMAELVHGGRLVHNLYGLGARIGPRGPRAAVLFGLGLRAISSPALTLDIDASTTWLRRDVTHATLVSQLRLVFGVRVLEDLALLAGPTWSLLWTNDPEEGPQASVGISQLPHGMRGWPGVVIGARGF